MIFFSTFVSPSKTSNSSGNSILGLPMFDRFPSPTKETLNSRGVPSSIFELDSDVLREKLPTAPVKFLGIFWRGKTSIETVSDTRSLALDLWENVSKNGSSQKSL